MGRFAFKQVHRSFTLLVLLHAIAWGVPSAALGDDTVEGQPISSTILSYAEIWQPLSHDSGPSKIQTTAFQAEGMTFPIPTADDGDAATDYQDAPGDDYLNSEYARQYPRLPII